VQDCPDARLALSLDGLTVGDAFGECYLRRADFAAWLFRREAPPGPWPLTDDSVMACAIADELRAHGEIRQDSLARRFADLFLRDMTRGYGPGAAELLSEIANGGDWRVENRKLFGGQGSLGNGGAMRVAPLGAWFADQPETRIVEQACLSAEVTHAHADGQAGAAAVALAAAYAWNHRVWKGNCSDRGSGLLDFVHEHMPKGPTRNGVANAMRLGVDARLDEAVALLGIGIKVMAMDTVPFCLWVARKHFDSCEAALWVAVAPGGDADTICAIVGGIVGLSGEPDSLPKAWIDRRENPSMFLDSIKPRESSEH